MVDPTPRFCINESSFRITNEAGDLEQLIGKFITLAQACRGDTGEQIGLWSGLYWVEVLPGVPLYGLLFEDQYSSKLDHDLRKALRELINRCITWDEANATPESVCALVEGQVFDLAHTIAFAHAQVGRRRAVAGLCLDSWMLTGPRDVITAEVTREVHFVVTEEDRLGFLRDVPEIEDLDEQSYMAHAPRAFSKLRFAEGLSKQFKRFSRPYPAMRRRVTKHLAALNDHFQDIHRAHSGEPDKTKREFSARCDIDSSPESPQTRKNKKAMQERIVVIDGQEVSCEWHTKFESTRDRIHFHPGSPEVANGHLVVGIFHEHLST